MSYTKEEVARHSKRDDVWIIVDRKVYDVTLYLWEHPGGGAILRNAGGDSSIGFHTQRGHGPVMNFLKEKIKEYYIGDLKD